MSKYIKYENIDFRINNSVFYSNSISISLRSNISPVLLSDGSLLRYAPENTVVGSLSSEFFLTGNIPSYIFPNSNSELPINCSFGGIAIENCYLKNMSFSVADYKPIVVKVDFDWFGRINSTNSTLRLNQVSSSSSRNVPLTGVAHSNFSYLIDTNKSFGFDEIFNFNYSEQCDRLPFFEIGQTIPFRVAKTNKIKNVTVEGNIVKKSNVTEIEGTDAYCELYIKDYENNLLNILNISGKLEGRSINIESEGILQSSLNITQRIAPLRNTL